MGIRNHASLVSRLFEVKGPYCFVCGFRMEPRSVDKWRRPTVEHVVERRHGGTDSFSNLALSHAVCNARRSRLLSYFQNWNDFSSYLPPMPGYPAVPMEDHA